MQDAGVPVVPGYHGENQDVGFLKDIKPCTVHPNRLARLMRKSRFDFL